MSDTHPTFEPVPEHALRQWRALQDALQEHWPTPCANDPGFTAAHPPADTLALCQYCPALIECKAFAVAFEPAAGVWAGERWPRRRRRRNTLRDESGEPAAVAPDLAARRCHQRKDTTT